MSQRRLLLLGYPANTIDCESNFFVFVLGLCADKSISNIFQGYVIGLFNNVTGSEQLQELVSFLEHQHIRLYKIEDRDGLQSSNNEVWNKSYAKVFLFS